MKLLYILLLLLAGTPGIGAETGSSHNFYYRNGIDENYYFVSRANLVTRDGFSEIFFGYVDENIGYRLNLKWAIEGGYRHASLKLPSGWREEYRPHFNLGYRGKMGEWENRHVLVTGISVINW